MTRENRKLDLDRMNDEELIQEYQKVFGEGTTWSNRAKAVDTILNKQFGGQQQRYVSLPCPRCSTETSHRTPGTVRDHEGKKVQQMQCVVCDTWTVVPTGEHGELFQQNVDEPDYTDFSGLDS